MIAGALRQHWCDAMATRPINKTSEPVTHDHKKFAPSPETSLPISDARASAVTVRAAT